MNLDVIQQYCTGKPMVTEEFPFDHDTIVWKVAGKMFCLGNISNFSTINLKCDPEFALELRETYPQVRPGYHMNKKLWNTVELEGMNEAFVLKLIDHSYNEVVQKLPSKVKSQINQ